MLVAIAVKVDSPGPVFFPQTRVGSRGTLFRIFKFRTMVADADAHKGEVMELNRHAQPGGDPRMFKIAQDPRVTRFGRFLRRYSVDELPQLINVLVGQMSLVGPRPLILDEDQHVHGWARRRLDVKPGITGLWQVYGGSAIPFGEMVQLDYLYVRTWSLWSDIRLLLRTLPVVAEEPGASASLASTATAAPIWQERRGKERSGNRAWNASSPVRARGRGHGPVQRPQPRHEPRNGRRRRPSARPRRAWSSSRRSSR